MIIFDITKEKPLHLAKAAEFFPRGDGTFISERTLTRWIKNGRNGIFLEGRIVGRSYVTSAESIERFTRKLTAAELRAATPGPPASTAHDQALEFLKSQGMMKALRLVRSGK